MRGNFHVTLNCFLIVNGCAPSLLRCKNRNFIKTKNNNKNCHAHCSANQSSLSNSVGLHYFDLFTCLSKVIIHCRVSGRTSPVGDRLTICGGATANEKCRRQCLQTLLCLKMKLLELKQNHLIMIQKKYKFYITGSSVSLKVNNMRRCNKMGITLARIKQQAARTTIKL